MAKEKLVADIIVEVLEKAGARFCYGVIGDSSNLLGYCISQSKIRWVHVRHEEVGGFAAGAGALQNNELTLCCGTCGPGSLHFINAIYHAHRNGAPVVLLATQLALNELGTNFPQEVNFMDVYKDCSHFCEPILTAQTARRVTTQAVQIALNRRGVSVLIIPEDIAAMTVEDDEQWIVSRPNYDVVADNDEVKKAAELIQKGKKIAVLAGSGCKGATNELKQLAEHLQLPVCSTSRGKDFVEPIGENYMGVNGHMGTEAGTKPVLDCDTLIMLGSDHAFSFDYPKHAKIVQIDINPANLGKRHPITLGIAGSVKQTINQLIDILPPTTNDAYLQQSQKLKEKVKTQLAEQAAFKSTGHIAPQYLTKVINDHLTEDAFVTADAGMTMVWMLQYIISNGQRRTYTSLLHATIASAYPEAIGLKMANPERQVVALCGDGGFTMLMGDILTLVQEKIPVKLVIYNNESLGFVEMEQQNSDIPNVYTHLQNPDFSKVAQAVGIWGKRITTYKEVEPAVIEWLAVDGPAILDVRTDKYELGLSKIGESRVRANVAIQKKQAMQKNNQS